MTNYERMTTDELIEERDRLFESMAATFNENELEALDEEIDIISGIIESRDLLAED